MSEFKIRIVYLGKKKMKFFNDKEPKEYHQFLVCNSEIIPNEYLYLSENRRNCPCMIWVLCDLLKAKEININHEFKFVINFEENKSAKFNTNNRNWMVLKTKNYFENTIEKIGFWNNSNYFYETVKKPKKGNENSNDIRLENKINWEKLFLFTLLIVLFFFFVLLIIKLVSKKVK